MQRWWPLTAATATVGLVVGLVTPSANVVGQAPPTVVHAGQGKGCIPPAFPHVCTAGSSGTAPVTVAGSHIGSQGTVAGTAVSSGAHGGTASGPSCSPGMRQFTWTAYAPACVAAFAGDNGGGASPGVTGTSVTFSYREPNTTEQSLIDAAVGSALVQSPQYFADLQTYANYFNSQYELYGRKVVLKEFSGQGDYVQEDYGGETGGAQSDAATAAGLGAFGDVTFPLYSSQPYWQYLAYEHVIGFGAVGYPQQWFDSYAPYEYSVYGPTGTNFANAMGNAACRRMVGMPAIFAGEPDFTGKVRAFGLITPDNPIYMQDGDAPQQILTECGQALAARVSYTINVAEYGTEATTIIAKMKASGVTTVLCICDPIMPILLSQESDQQQYYPEWFGPSWADPDSRNFAADQQDHTIALGNQFPPVSAEEAYKVYLTASGGKQPAEQYYYVAYYELLPIFGALQDAGPDLTPQSFENGWFGLPAVVPGDILGGAWRFGPGSFDPDVGEYLVWWSPTATSQGDGKAGAYQWCDRGAEVIDDNPASFGGPHQQLDCFGH